MRIAVNGYRGEAPRVTPRALPPTAAQQAINCRLMTGDLEAWRQFALEHDLANAGTVETIYNLGGSWLSWGSDVDVARGAIAGDTSLRIFLTGPDEYTEPRWTNLALATTGSEPFPVTTRPLGVPGPDGPPSIAVGVDPNIAAAQVNILDEGDAFSNWTNSGFQTPHLGDSNVTQSNVVGDPAPSYRLEYGRNVGYPVWLYRDFGLASLVAIQVSVDFMFAPPSSAEDYKQMIMHVGVDQVGAGMRVAWTSDGGFGIGSAINYTTTAGSSYATSTEPGTPAYGVWYRCEVQVVKNPDQTQTITARLFNGSAMLGELTTTNTFTQGPYIGFMAETGTDSDSSGFLTYYDNISVQGSGAVNTSNTATSYVYTYVNDLGEESTPSEATNTVLRPDGVSVTVTTATDVPTGYDSTWGITTKRIYRAVTGATGTFFRFVAEIPLAQADYVDSLTDVQLGEVLESEDWDLPPTNLRGLLALPNGVMAGFAGNQLCFSAQNHPHAWPVGYRLTVDTDIVTIGNIDTTVVIGTEAFPYLAIGTDPSAYSMTKLEVPQACVSKRSVAYLIGIGVVFASPDGLIAVAGNGIVRNLTNSIFTREQWQALNPESIVGVAHDDVYHFFYDTDPATPTVYLLDTFEGPATQELANHTPDVCPAGFAWVLPGSGAGLELDGVGGAVSDGLGYFNDSNEAPASWTPLDLGATWTIEMDGNFTGGTSEGGPGFTFIARTPNDFNGVRITVQTGPVGFITVGGGTEFVGVESTMIPEGPHSISMLVGQDGLALFVDGDLVTTASGSTSAYSQLVGAFASIDGDGEGTVSITRVAVYPEGTP